MRERALAVRGGVAQLCIDLYIIYLTPDIATLKLLQDILGQRAARDLHGHKKGRRMSKWRGRASANAEEKLEDNSKQLLLCNLV